MPEPSATTPADADCTAADPSPTLPPLTGPSALPPRSEADQQYYDGTIHDYDLEVDCYNIAFEAHPDTTAALQFHQVGRQAGSMHASSAVAVSRRQPPGHDGTMHHMLRQHASWEHPHQL